MPAGHARCSVQLTPAAVVIRGEGINRSWPLEHLELRREGFDQKTIVLAPGGDGGPRVMCRNPDFLAALKDHPVAARLFRRSKRRGNGLALVLALPLLVLLGLAAALALGGVPPRAMEAGVSVIPVAFDVRVGELMLPGMKASLGPDDAQPEVKAALDGLTRVLSAARADTRIPITLHIVKSPVVNAFALPGGSIIVTTEALREARSAEEVAGLLAHEISHVSERHATRSVLQRAGLTLVLSMVMGDSGTLGGLLTEQAAQLTSLAFSRDMEHQADVAGVALLQKAGRDPAGLAAFLKRLSAYDVNGGPELLRTHPVTSDRIAALSDRSTGPRSLEPVPFDWEALRGKIERVATAPTP
jgi:predicted Zn-dependent protease